MRWCRRHKCGRSRLRLAGTNHKTRLLRPASRHGLELHVRAQQAHRCPPHSDRSVEDTWWRFEKSSFILERFYYSILAIMLGVFIHDLSSTFIHTHNIVIVHVRATTCGSSDVMPEVIHHRIWKCGRHHRIEFARDRMKHKMSPYSRVEKVPPAVNMLRPVCSGYK